MNLKLAAVALVTGLATPVFATAVDPALDIIKCLDEQSVEKPAFTMSTDRNGVTTIKLSRSMKLKGERKAAAQACIAKKHPTLRVK